MSEKKKAVVLLSGGIEPPHEAVVVLDGGRRGCLLDPPLRNDPSFVPFSSTQKEKAESGVIPAADEDPAAPMAAAAYGLHLLTV